MQFIKNAFKKEERPLTANLDGLPAWFDE